jgi:hypothetical protein
MSGGRRGKARGRPGSSSVGQGNWFGSIRVGAVRFDSGWAGLGQNGKAFTSPPPARVAAAAQVLLSIEFLLYSAIPNCFSLLTHWIRRADSRAACTAGKSRAIRTAMLAMTTNKLDQGETTLPSHRGPSLLNQQRIAPARRSAIRKRPPRPHFCPNRPSFPTNPAGGSRLLR